MSFSHNNTFKILPVTTSQQQELFLDVPKVVYANDPNWVSPLRSSIAKQLSDQNTFLTYGKFQQFIAVSSDNKPVGRVVAAVNQRLIDKEKEQLGLIGYFECINNFEIAQSLLDNASEWLRSHNLKIARGPIDLSTHNNCLFLVDGFDSPPMVMMPYNPPYYPEFWEQYGWEKAKDAYAYNFPLDTPLPPEFAKAYRVACKSGVNFRTLRTKGKEFEADCISLYNLFNTAFADNWSSTPRTQEEFVEEAKDLQGLVDPDVFPVAEYNGEMVGFFMGLPDYNIPLKHVNGKLNLPGILKFLWYKRQIDRGRVIAICSLPEYKRKMVPLALIYLGLQAGIEKGKPYKRAELSWVYEDNFPSRKLIAASGGKIYKTYRIYEKAL
ncbi:hypothetical protein [Merismopedia glauca]|uniref:N-acetyltransferase domain-containing protein n=1 Tax=Merismopedia glauca CCAP 1448/3 TaxID=1296344 RepID=A0A2T1C6C9_9CYAN|nr:hypothetical protein [Merismopedia glauca]PSB03697.1 hypothetical protein C7B64_07210 [Merismopedia glauca CCAP 1448/3]